MAKKYRTTEEWRAWHQADLARRRQAFGVAVRFPFCASNMAAGPCAIAAKLNGKMYRAEDAPLPPFDGCSHPDQCACMFGAGRIEF